MAQTKEGALKIAAKISGITPEQYLKYQEAGFKWCVLCRDWQSIKDFGIDSTRSDGLAPSCRDSRNEIARLKHIKKTRPRPGRNFVPAIDGDKKQARGRVNHFIRYGLMPPPNAIPCKDCGHEWRFGQRRHEYDHYLGYAANNHEKVEVVCTICHKKRSNSRVCEIGESNKRKHYRKINRLKKGN